jgi:hypothetical protein
MSVRLCVCASVRTEQLCFHWTNFHEKWYLNISRKYVEKIQVLMKYVKKNWYFTCTSIYIYDIWLMSS